MEDFRHHSERGHAAGDVSENASKQLKIWVETCVRPVHASRKTKCRMREELWQHITETYQGEIARDPREEVAIEKTRVRFGDPKNLSRELQQSVSRVDRFSYYSEKMRLEEGESCRHFTLKILFFSVAVHLVGLSSALLAILGSRKFDEFGLLCKFLGVMCLVSFIVTWLWIYLMDGVRRHLFSEPLHRSYQKAAVFLGSSLFLLPIFGTLSCVGFGLEPQLLHLPFLMAFLHSPLFVVASYLGARREGQMRAREKDWLALSIAE